MTVAKASLREAELRRIISSSSWFTEILEAVRDCDPPGWLVGGGVIRNLLWNRLHDLFGLLLRRNPGRVTPEIFRRRVVEKRIVERWPKVRVIHDDAEAVSA